MAIDRYALVDSGGNTVNLIVADPAVFAPPVGYTLVLAATAAAFSPLRQSVITVDLLLSRFTAAELQSLMTLCQTDPTAHLGLIRWLSAGIIDLSGAAIQNALNYLVTKTVLTAARATAILTP